MKIAVLSLTRDRLEYTKRCFVPLHRQEVPFDHYILDQGSGDGTQEYLTDRGQAEGRYGVDIRSHFTSLVLLDKNIGISRGMNVLLEIVDGQGYDVIVKFDNDCELTDPGTLEAVCRVALEGNMIASPRILGLNNPPPVMGQFTVGEEPVLDIPQIGGIFLAAPASVYDVFRYNPDNPIFGGDDVEICAWWRKAGGRCGYLANYTANHYETTRGQQERFPEYFERKALEMAR